MRRTVEMELLDELPAGDSRAVRSRSDLRRLNYIMGHAAILSGALRNHAPAGAPGARPLQLVELGAGDGTLFLELARRCSIPGVRVEVTLVDRLNLVSLETRRAFAALAWTVESVATDVFVWLEQRAPTIDVLFANLFLHHFADARLQTLLQLAEARTQAFVACEPRRSPRALWAARMLWLIGCNAVTQHDAVVSVRAGFYGRELSSLWPDNGGWVINERPAGLFSHQFAAHRNA